jgi:hypothetical protein
MRLGRHVPKSLQESILVNHKRVCIVNIWRPIQRQVNDHPLAFAESVPVADEDLVKVAHKYDDRTGRKFAVKYSPGQKFWYWSNMRVDETLVLLYFDSAKFADGKHPSRCAHASFHLPGSVTNQRESIGARCIVVGDHIVCLG